MEIGYGEEDMENIKIKAKLHPGDPSGAESSRLRVPSLGRLASLATFDEVLLALSTWRRLSLSCKNQLRRISVLALVSSMVYFLLLCSVPDLSIWSGVEQTSLELSHRFELLSIACFLCYSELFSYYSFFLNLFVDYYQIW